jgi:hypothetical protein
MADANVVIQLINSLRPPLKTVLTELTPLEGNGGRRKDLQFLEVTS